MVTLRRIREIRFGIIWGLSALATAVATSEQIPPATGGIPELAILAIESFDDPVPVNQSSFVGLPRESYEADTLWVLPARCRFWQQDLHMDVVIRLNLPEGVSADSVSILGIFRDEADNPLGQFVIDPPPGDQFIFFPELPQNFIGEGTFHTYMLQGETILAQVEKPFRIESFDSHADTTGTIRLQIPNRDRISARSIPVSTGIPFPRGTLWNVGQLQVVDASGKPIPFQVKDNARWSKFGSIKWVFCSFVVDLNGEPENLYVRYGPEVDGQQQQGALTIDHRESGFPVIDAGQLQFDHGIWWPGPSPDTRRKLFDSSALTGAFVEHEDGRIYVMPKDTRFTVEESGPERVLLRTEGWYRNEEEGRRFCKYVTYYEIFRDSPLWRVRHTWIFTGDGNVDRIASMGWRFPAAAAIENTAFLSDSRSSPHWLNGDYLVQWDYDHFDVGGDGKSISEFGEARAPGVARMDIDNITVYFGARDFWQNYPSELEFTNEAFHFLNWPRHNRPAQYTFDKELIMQSGEPAATSTAARYALEHPDYLTSSEWRLNAAQLRFAHEGEALDFRLPDAYARDPIYSERGREDYWLENQPESVNAQGIARTEEFWIYVDGDKATNDKAALMLALDRETVRIVVDPVWMAASGAFYDIHHQDLKQFPEEEFIYAEAARSPARVAERLGSYGMWIFGDIPAWRPLLESKEPDFYRMFRMRHHAWPYSWIPYARSGDPELLKYADAATRQMSDAGFTHYIDDHVDKFTHDARRLGHRRRGPVPWADHSYTRNYSSKVDFLLYAWYLTGYERAHEVFETWAELTKIEEPLTWRGSLRPRRPTIMMLLAWLETYEATWDPWFLVAAHAVGDLHLEGYRERRWWGRAWVDAELQYLRFTGCRDFEEVFLDVFVARTGDERRMDHYNRRTPHYSTSAFAWKLTGDPYHLGRISHLLDWGNIQTDIGDALPWYFQGFTSRGDGTFWTTHTPYYLQGMPSGLWALAQAGHRPDPIHNTIRVSPNRGAVADGSPGQRLRSEFYKETDKPLTIILELVEGFIMPRSHSNTEHYADYRLRDEQGTIVLEGQWRVAETIEPILGASAPAGIYTLEVENTPGIMLPLSAHDQPERLVLQPGEPMHTLREGIFHFKVPEDVESFTIKDASPRVRIWDHTGTMVWNAADYTSPEETEDTVIIVPEDGRGKLWRISIMRGSFQLSDEIPPYFSLSPTKWFD